MNFLIPLKFNSRKSSSNIYFDFMQIFNYCKPLINHQQLYCLLSIYKNNCNQNQQQNKKNILLNDKYTFGSMQKLEFYDHVICPNDCTIPDSDIDIIQCFLTKYTKKLSYSLIMFLFILKQMEKFIPITAIKLIKQFITEKPNFIQDIGIEKRVCISLYSNDERNFLFKNDVIILGKDLKMIVHSLKCVKCELTHMKLEINFQNVQDFLKKYMNNVIGISFTTYNILLRILDAYDYFEIQHYSTLYETLISSPLLILEIENLKMISIFGHEGDFYQFGYTYNLPAYQRIQNEQVDNYQFYIKYQQGKWKLFDGKYNSSNIDILQSKFGTWKVIQDKTFQLQPSDTFRINSYFYSVEEVKEENQNNTKKDSFLCQVICQNISDIPEITNKKIKNKRSQKLYNQQKQIQPKSIEPFSDYQNIQIIQEFNCVS
ncbi:unnamed protein product [Paramecium sonneborni]|uniref:Uncharacterized protein n=1 Tax=Paramecium sonneborni TaxID=65129 RepID=A0A8S1N2F6_9CILI|nr:unnamed protein product [Paramecium sonneborni]